MIICVQFKPIPQRVPITHLIAHQKTLNFFVHALIIILIRKIIFKKNIILLRCPQNVPFSRKNAFNCLTVSIACRRRQYDLK